MRNMFDVSGLTTISYDSTLIGWKDQGVSDLSLGADGLTYCNGESAKYELINTYRWQILADSLDCSGSGGCLAFGIEFEYQSEIDNFSTNYPGCYIIQGGTGIDPAVYNGITNLNGLSQITLIEGSLEVNSAAGIGDFQGLHNLKSIGNSLTLFGGVHSNNTLNDLSGLDSLESIGGRLNLSGIWNNLSSLHGLENLESVGDDLVIKNLDGLTDMSALSSLNTIQGSLTVSWNDLLPNLQGLGNIINVTGAVDISINPLLANVDELINLESIGGKLYIRNNTNLLDLDGLNALTTIGGELEISLVQFEFHCSTFKSDNYQWYFKDKKYWIK